MNAIPNFPHPELVEGYRRQDSGILQRHDRLQYGGTQGYDHEFTSSAAIFEFAQAIAAARSIVVHIGQRRIRVAAFSL